MGNAAASIVGGIGGAIGGIYAGNKAASAQRAAAGAANDRLGAAQSEALAQLNPYSQYGKQALVPLSALLYGKNYDPNTGEFTGDVSAADRFNSFQQSPGYQYQLDQGLKAIQRQNAATGTLLGGNTLKELQEYGNNLANQDYYNYINTLFNQAGIGQNAALNSASLISNTGANMAGYSYAGGMGNAQKYANLSNFLFGLSGIAANDLATAGGVLPNNSQSGASSSSGGGTYNPSIFSSAGLSSMFAGGAGGGAAGSGAAGGAGVAAAASDRRLKENLVKVGEEKGFNIYEFNYINQPNTRFRGVIAQEVQDAMPEAIIELETGYLGVDYSKIGIDFREV